MVAAEQDFMWVTNAEPHATRRKEILAKHGAEVRKLYGTDVSTAWQVRCSCRTRLSCSRVKQLPHSLSSTCSLMPCKLTSLRGADYCSPFFPCAPSQA